MQNRVEESVRTKMEELRLICDTEIPIQQQRLDTAFISFRKSLESTKAKTHQTVENQAKLRKLKAQMREVEDDLVKALAVKNRRDAKWMATEDSVAAAKARIEELKRIVVDQRTRKNEYAAIISHHSEALAACIEKRDNGTECRGEVEEAIFWYNRVLDFRIECGHGVRFIFTNINSRNPKEEYSFTIRHENNIYTLLDCDPHLNDTKELIHELNRNNGLFKFVRTIREKFQEAAASGIFPQVSSIDQDASTISVSASVSSISTDSKSESPAKQIKLQPGETNRLSGKVNCGRGDKPAVLSPEPASSLRRSPRFKVKK